MRAMAAKSSWSELHPSQYQSNDMPLLVSHDSLDIIAMTVEQFHTLDSCQKRGVGIIDNSTPDQSGTDEGNEHEMHS